MKMFKLQQTRVLSSTELHYRGDHLISSPLPSVYPPVSSWDLGLVLVAVGGYEWSESCETLQLWRNVRLAGRGWFSSVQFSCQITLARRGRSTPTSLASSHGQSTPAAWNLVLVLFLCIKESESFNRNKSLIISPHCQSLWFENAES